MIWEDDHGIHWEDTPRRILALIQGLPIDSATWRQDKPGWTNQDELAARAVEGVNHWGFITARLLGAKKPPLVERSLTHPDRPTDEAEKPEAASPAEVAKFFGQLK